MATTQFTVPRRAIKRVVPVPRSNAVIRLDVSDEHRFAIADGQEFRRLFDIARWYEGHGYSRTITYAVQRMCPKCKRMNSTSVTGNPGYPDGIDGLWNCDKCAHTLAKIDANRGRVSVRHRAIEQVAVTVAAVIETMERIETEDADYERGAWSAGIPYERFSFIPPVGATDTPDEPDEFPF